ncbi:MAG: type II toxin-antitoxin system RelE/ParE family toxin [Planctomycetaceae bacterium]|nr:type II toxin-antitoxin system RelE/ParE family toxin [Planctomycetaceae bacterium]
MGQSRDDLASGIRSFSVGNYAVFYTPAEIGVEIVQIVHAARDVPSAFRRRN